MMETFLVPKCTIHKQQNSQSLSFASENETQRVCSLCPIEGNKYVISNQSFQSMSMLAIADLLQTEAKAFNRHKEITNMIEKFKGEYSKDDNQVLNKMMREIEEESKAYKECCLRIQGLKGQLIKVYALVKYFKSLRDGDLYLMKVRLSSQSGLKKFVKKCKDHAAIIRKGVHETFKKMEQNLRAQEQNLAEIQSRSLLNKLRQCLITRKAIIPKIQNPPNNDSSADKKGQL